MTGTLSRVYSFTIMFVDDNTIDISGPTSTEVRTRGLNISGSLASSDLLIDVTDSLSDISFDSPYSYNNPNFDSKTAKITGNNSTSGNISTADVHYDLDTDGIDLNNDGDYLDSDEEPPELPSWFVENNWHELVYIVYSSTEPLPGDTTAGNDCKSLGGPCVTLNGTGNPNDNKRAVVLSAGPQLSGQDRSTSADMADYYEDDNANGDDILLKASESGSFNDKSGVVSEAP